MLLKQVKHDVIATTNKSTQHKLHIVSLIFFIFNVLYNKLSPTSSTSTI